MLCTYGLASVDHISTGEISSVDSYQTFRRGVSIRVPTVCIVYKGSQNIIMDDKHARIQKVLSEGVQL